jgi:hypothetical protein
LKPPASSGISELQLWPQYQNNVFTISQPAFFGEMAFMLWLSIKGAKPQALDTAVRSPATG